MDRHLKGLSILGSTGSVGRQTLDIVRNFPDRFKVITLGANTNHETLAQQIREFKPRYVSYNTLGGEPAELSENVSRKSLNDVATADGVDVVVAATTGDVALRSTFNAIKAGKDIAIANKEAIIMAGPKLMSQASKNGSSLLPVDSEPSAIWQCLRGEEAPVDRLVITASGGALRDVQLSRFNKVNLSDVLSHPTWKMGPKITVDSATMMNKAFEVIEAKWLFGVDWDRIEVVIHPESIIHSMVDFADGSTKAQLSNPDMRLPIQHALFFPERPANTKIKRFESALTKNLTFRELEKDRYPCFEMALKYAKRGGTWPSALCGADEEAVNAFLKGTVSFIEIEPLIREAIDPHLSTKHPSLDEMMESAQWGRNRVQKLAGVK